ncbi:MAG: hypothetical protein ACJ746_28120 [Bryobacteraceae bacterium]
MTKKLVIIRNDGCSTYKVQGEQDRPPQTFIGGVSLDLPRLKTELIQHGCPEQVAANALQAVESSGYTTIYL